MQQYKVSLTTKLKPPQTGIIAIEPEDYTAAEVKALKDSGAKVLAYLSAGSVSDERSYYAKLKPYCLKELEDWPHERYLDLRHPEVREWLQGRAKSLKKKGFDGYWIDNIDIYEEYRSTEMFTSITQALMAIKAVGGYVMINGGIAYVTDLIAPHKVQLGAYKDPSNSAKMKKALKAKGFSGSIIEADGLQKVQSGAFSSRENADQLVLRLHTAGFETAKRISLTAIKPKAVIDGVTQEEVFSRITDYDGEGKFGKQKQAESERYQAYIRLIIKNGLGAFLLEYTTDNTLKLRIRAFCDVTGACYYISGDKDL